MTIITWGMKVFAWSWLSNPSLKPHQMKPMRHIISLLVLSMVLTAPAHAEDDRNWTTADRIHRGLLIRTANGSSGLEAGAVGGHSFIGKFTLTYALWSLGGEPVQDYVFSWDWLPGNLVVGRGAAGDITTGDLAKYPDLAREFFGLKPGSVTIETELEFYNDQNHRAGVATKTIRPDLIGISGEIEPLHVPGSPNWETFFNFEYNDPVNHNQLADSERAIWNKKNFQDAKRVQLVRPKLPQWNGLKLC